jgi:hypothetical protein
MAYAGTERPLRAKLRKVLSLNVLPIGSSDSDVQKIGGRYKTPVSV